MIMPLLFICAGNSTRSPMAEGIARALFPNLPFASAGVEMKNTAANPLAIDTMREIGIDISAHVPRQLDEAMVAEASVLVVMTAYIGKIVARRFPGGVQKLCWLGQDIRDPLEDYPDQYPEVRDVLREAVARCLNEGWPELP